MTDSTVDQCDETVAVSEIDNFDARNIVSSIVFVRIMNVLFPRERVYPVPIYLGAEI